MDLFDLYDVLVRETNQYTQYFEDNTEDNPAYKTNCSTAGSKV